MSATPEKIVADFDEGWEVFLSSAMSEEGKVSARAELVEAIRSYGAHRAAEAVKLTVEMCCIDPTEEILCAVGELQTGGFSDVAEAIIGASDVHLVSLERK